MAENWELMLLSLRGQDQLSKKNQHMIVNIFLSCVLGAQKNRLSDRARKLYTSARIYEWKFGKGEWKLPFASPTGRVL